MDSLWKVFESVRSWRGLADWRAKVKVVSVVMPTGTRLKPGQSRVPEPGYWLEQLMLH